MLIIYVLYYFTVLSNNYLTIKIIFNTSFYVFILTYLYTALINPGIPDRKYYVKNFNLQNKGQIKDYFKCSKCNIIIPKSFKIMHCSICNVCIINHDHHCPWTGKCIGKNNLKSFYIFVTFLFIYIIMIFAALMGFLVKLQADELDKKHGNK